MKSVDVMAQCLLAGRTQVLWLAGYHLQQATDSAHSGHLPQQLTCVWQCKHINSNMPCNTVHSALNGSDAYTHQAGLLQHGCKSRLPRIHSNILFCSRSHNCSIANMQECHQQTSNTIKCAAVVIVLVA